MKHALMVSIGTDGDVYPFLNLGLALRKRGFRVTVATHEHLARFATEADLGFRSIVSNAETNQLLQNPAFWHPIKGPFVVGRWGSRLFGRHYQALKELASTESSFVVASPGMLAVRVLQEATRIPVVSVILQPWVIPSLYTPPVIMGGLTLPRRTPRWIIKLYFRFIDAIGRHIVGPEVGRLRASFGLAPIRNMFRWWWFSPELVLGLFPDWFGKPQPDWPRQIRLTDFPLAGPRARPLPEELCRFCKQSQRTIAFTFGTGMMHASKLFEEGIAACRSLQARGVFLTRFRSQLPKPLPEFVHHCEFAPLEDLLPLCAAVVHHGGIGTVAASLATGTPQLIIPFGFDQMDNAIRVKELQAGAWLKSSQRNHRAIASALETLLSGEPGAAARKVAGRLTGRNGTERAADYIEAFVGSQR